MTAVLLVAALVCAAAALWPSHALRALSRRREVRERRAALPALADALGAALGAGLSLPLAFAEVAPALPPPVDACCRRIASSLRLGDGLERALGALDEVMPRDDVAPLALVLVSFARSGGRVRRSLERCGALLRSRLALEDERAALTAQARLSAAVLVALPPLGALSLGLLMPDAVVALVRRVPVLVVAALALEAAGAVWLGRIVRPRRNAGELASVIDAVVVCLDAGMSFPAALARITDRSTASAAPAVRRLLADLALGRGSRAAFAAFATAGADEARVAGLVSASARLGSPLAELLVAQADAIRDEARQRAQAHARRLPVLMLFPLALCVLPALLIVFLGPPLLSLLD
ncbi:MAG TPA: type II secretion system F family protein [Candidatus Limnocylindria bacterium]|nr:type II secretion system F family protein [Candidatus Limnocylindria bacterium]